MRAETINRANPPGENAVPGRFVRRNQRFKHCRIGHTQGGSKEVTCDTALVAMDLRMSPTLFGFAWLAT